VAVDTAADAPGVEGDPSQEGDVEHGGNASWHRRGV